MARFLRVERRSLSPIAEKAMSIIRPLSRRRFLKISGIAAGGLTLPRFVFAQNKKAVHFTLPWVAEGSNLFTFAA
jgi:hypothetical protein